jgi:hypothetical protein
MAKNASLTKTEADLDARIAATKDALRADALRGARAFKRSWLEFAEVLTRVREDERWSAWGFDSFEQYCARELHIRRDTALKLTGSYKFLERARPEALRRDGVQASLPDYRSVDVLARVEGTPAARSPAFKELRDAVIDDGLAPGATSARLREILPPKPAGPGESRREAARFAAQARRLLAALQSSSLLADALPEPGRLSLDALIDRLEALSETEGAPD